MKEHGLDSSYRSRQLESPRFSPQTQRAALSYLNILFFGEHIELRHRTAGFLRLVANPHGISM
jgi:hypothetical protein